MCMTVSVHMCECKHVCGCTCADEELEVDCGKRVGWGTDWRAGRWSPHSHKLDNEGLDQGKPLPEPNPVSWAPAPRKVCGPHSRVKEEWGVGAGCSQGLAHLQGGLCAALFIAASLWMETNPQSISGSWLPMWWCICVQRQPFSMKCENALRYWYGKISIDGLVKMDVYYGTSFRGKNNLCVSLIMYMETIENISKTLFTENIFIRY